MPAKFYDDYLENQLPPHLAQGEAEALARHYYDFLDLPRGTTLSEVKKDFKSFVTVHHPDRRLVQNRSPTVSQEDMENYKLAVNAYKHLMELFERDHIRSSSPKSKSKSPRRVSPARSLKGSPKSKVYSPQKASVYVSPKDSVSPRLNSLFTRKSPPKSTYTRKSPTKKSPKKIPNMTRAPQDWEYVHTKNSTSGKKSSPKSRIPPKSVAERGRRQGR